MVGGFGSRLSKQVIGMASKLEKAAKRFGFAEGSQLEGDALEAYIQGLPPRATILFSEYEAPTVAEKVVKRVRKAAKKK